VNVNKLIAWTDIETNGRLLEYKPYPDTPELLAVGLFVTDAHAPFRFRGSVNHVVWPADLNVSEIFETMTDDAFAIHEASGLNDFYRYWTRKPSSPAWVEQDVIELLSRYGDQGDYVCAGRDIEWFVWPWLVEWMPELSSWFGSCLDLNHVESMLCLAELDVPSAEPVNRAAKDAQLNYEEFLDYVGYIGFNEQDTGVEPPQARAFLR
jgi:oligoribonuclease (3'-5' exoribonuclease)